MSERNCSLRYPAANRTMADPIDEPLGMSNKTKIDSSEPSVEDRFRQAAGEGRTLFCAWLSINSPLLIGSIGDAGWDCILIDQQHGLGGHDAMVGCLTAAKAEGLAHSCQGRRQ